VEVAQDTGYVKVVELEKEPDLSLIPKEWIPALPFKSLRFLCTAVFLDFDCTLFIQDYYESMKPLEHILNTLTIMHDKSIPKKYDLEGWKVGDICVCQYHLDKKWYRAIVKEVVDSAVTVRFVDYGNVETCHPNELRRIPGAIEIPIQCHQCTLPLIAPPNGGDKWDVDVLDQIHAHIVDKHCEVELEELPGGGYAAVKLTLPDRSDFFELLIQKRLALRNDVFGGTESPKEEDGNSAKSKDVVVSEVDLTSDIHKDENASSEVDLTKNLNVEKPSTSTGSEDIPASYHWSEVLNSLSPSQRPKITYSQLVIPEDIKFLEVELSTVMSPTKILLLATTTDHLYLSKLKNEFAHICEEMQRVAPQLPAFEPHLYEPCVACFTQDEEWYRAFILSILPMKQYLVQYVDYGNIEVLPGYRIRPLRKDWESVPVQSFPCVLNNITLNPRSKAEATMTELSKLLVGKNLVAEITSYDPLTADLKIDGELAYQELIDCGDYTLGSHE